LAGKKSEELDEMIDEKAVNAKDLSQVPFIERIKVMIYRLLQKHAFIVILALASIPNPLFDLAGFLCGHFLIPFGVFFGACFIGKAIIKVSIQSFFVIFCFSQHQVEIILNILKNFSPKLRDLMLGAIEKQKKTLFAEKVEDEARPLIAMLWEYFVMAMIAYFVYSIINSLVQNYLNEQGDQNSDNKNKKKKSKSD
jgi:vacuole membrane protein 1